MDGYRQSWVYLAVLTVILHGCDGDPSNVEEPGSGGAIAGAVAGTSSVVENAGGLAPSTEQATGAGTEAGPRAGSPAQAGQQTPSAGGSSREPSDASGGSASGTTQAGGRQVAGDPGPDSDPTSGGQATSVEVPNGGAPPGGGHAGDPPGEAGSPAMMDDIMPPPEQREAMPAGDAEDANAQPISQMGFTRFAQLINGDIIGQHASGMSLLTEEGRIDFDDRYGRFIDATDIVTNPPDAFETTVVLTSAGLYTLNEGVLDISPLANILPNATRITALTAQPMSALWFATDAGLYRWSDNEVRRIMAPDQAIDWTTSPLRSGRLFNTSVVWAKTETSLLAVGVRADGPVAWTLELAEPIDAMTTTRSGLWIGDEITLSVLSPAGRWKTWRRPTESVVIEGHPDEATLWMSNGRSLHQWTGEILIHRVNAPLHTQLTVDDEGRALLGNVQGITSVSPGRFLTIAGLDDRIIGPTEVQITMSNADDVDEVSVRVDNAEPVELSAPNWRLNLSPAEISPGMHTLYVQIRYTDGEVIESSAEFFGPPGWALDIEPLQQAHCARCHGMGGSAHLMVDSAAWQAEIAAIIDDVETGRMPLSAPALDASLVALIKGWRDAGFLE
ncbi:MAG: hypothetical protein VX589_06600 [Myxococcota bacterium]|nr:hypothetical protein [Myxococcota bacterium]